MSNYSYFAMPLAKTVNHGLESLSYIGSKLWDSIPSHMKQTDSINEFKHVIKTWKKKKVATLKASQIFSDCHIKIHRSRKRRAIIL